MLRALRPAILFVGLFTILTGLAYPLLVTAAARALFPFQAAGSLVHAEGQVVGSRLIGQSFEDPSYFWGRPSATTPRSYNGAASAGSNLGPSNPALVRAVQERVAILHAVDPGQASVPIPVDLVTSSASGLDPHISPAAALYQVHRVARIRGLPEDRVRTLVEQHVEPRAFGLFGERRVSVLLLNTALDAMVPDPQAPRPSEQPPARPMLPGGP